jgi:CheY-like chemotaxis protein/anti-sigma regulatory factor (Ser/Thr protein kinase)
LKSGELPETERERVTRLQIAARSLLHLIDDILEFSKLQSGTLAVRDEVVEPASIVAEAIEFVRQDADLKDLPIEAHLQDGLPTWVRSDGDRMRQILINLLTNAVKFTPSGRVFVQCAHGADEELVLTVADTGVGIPAERLETIFLPYERIGKVRASGTGLGLTIVRTIVDSLGGKIGVESEEGVGTRVTVRLPAPTVKVDFVPSPREEPEETYSPTVSVAPVLIVEDVPMNAEVVRAFLEQAGCASIVASNGVEAIEACRQEKFSAILMDVEMPVMGGLDATRVIRGKEGPPENRDVPIIALTAFASRADSAACLGAGMNDYLMKPVDRVVLYRALEKWGVLTSVPQDEVEATRSKDKAPDFEPNRLSDLRRAVTATRFREIVTESRQAVVDFVDAVARTPRNSQVNKILLHKLVSTAGNIGLVGLSERARELEAKIADQTLLDEHDGEALKEMCEVGAALLDGYLDGPNDAMMAIGVANARGL